MGIFNLMSYEKVFASKKVVFTWNLKTTFVNCMSFA